MYMYIYIYIYIYNIRHTRFWARIEYLLRTNAAKDVANKSISRKKSKHTSVLCGQSVLSVSLTTL